MKLLSLLFVFMLSLYSTDIGAQISKSYNYNIDTDIFSMNDNYSNTGLVIFEPSSNSYKTYTSKSPNFFIKKKPMYHVQLELNRQADSFNPYNVNNPFEAITLGLTNLLFDKIQGK